MTKIVIIIGIFLATVFLLICKALISSIKEMKDPDSMFVEPLVEIKDTSDYRLKKCFDETNAWAKFHELKFTRYIDFASKVSGKTINTMFWTNEERTSALALYYVEGKTHYDFVSKFEHNHGLTTSSGKDGAILPNSPGNFAQYFPGSSLNEIWDYHSEAERLIIQKFGYSKVPFNEDIISEVKDSIARQTTFITSLFLWQLRGPYWFFVRKNIMSNKTVETQLT